MMGGAVIHQGDLCRTGRERLVIQFQAGDATANPGMIFNDYLVSGRAVTKNDFEISPRFGYTGVESQHGVLYIEP